jgi:drug/metabolite transporter (DMT)-like permease
VIKNHNLTLGVAFITLAFLCVSVMSAFGKLLSTAPTGQIVFFQNSISFFLLLPLVLSKGTAEIHTHRLPLHIVRAMTGLLSQALFFIAVKKIALVDAVLLANAAPLFIPLVALFWMKIRITPLVVASLVTGFVGVILILKPGMALFSQPSSLVALSAAFFSAIALVSVNILSNTEKSNTILFYYFLISTILTLPFAFWHWKTPSGTEWIYLFGVGLFMALSQLFIILAYRHASASEISPFNYTVVIFSGILGWLFWGTAIGWLSLLGIILVCLGGICSIVFNSGNKILAPFFISHGHHVFEQSESPKKLFSA